MRVLGSLKRGSSLRSQQLSNRLFFSGGEIVVTGNRRETQFGRDTDDLEQLGLGGVDPVQFAELGPRGTAELNLIQFVDGQDFGEVSL